MNIWARFKPRTAGQPLKDEAQESRLFGRRATTALLLILAAILLLTLRYVYLQVVSHDEFSTRSLSNRVRIVPVAPNRGLVYDRRGRPVAENLPAYRLELVPEKVANLEQAILSLGRIIDLPENAFEKFQTTRSRYRVFDSVPLKFNLTEK